MKPLSPRDGILLLVFAASASILLFADREGLVYGASATKVVCGFAGCLLGFALARRLWDVPRARWSWLGRLMNQARLKREGANKPKLEVT